jgi:hypothetical protein
MNGNPYPVAIDNTGLSRTNPSYHYIRRINGSLPKILVKVSVNFDTAKKKFCAVNVHVLPRHDIKDAKSLLKNNKPKILIVKKDYDVN